MYFANLPFAFLLAIAACNPDTHRPSALGDTWVAPPDGESDDTGGSDLLEPEQQQAAAATDFVLRTTSPRLRRSVYPHVAAQSATTLGIAGNTKR